MNVEWIGEFQIHAQENIQMKMSREFGVFQEKRKIVVK